MLVDTERAVDLDDVMDKMLTGDDAYRYSVAWIDCQSTGSRLGRSVLTRGDHARLADLPARLAGDPDRARAFVPRQLARVPLTPPSGLLNPLTVGAFNEFWFRKAPEAPARQAPPHDRLLPSPRRCGRVEPPLRQPRLPAVPVRGARRRGRDGPPHHRAPHRGAPGLVPRRAQALRPGRPGPALVPDARVDPGPRPAGRAARDSTGCSTISTTRCWRPAAGSTWPRTRGWPRTPSGPCTPASTASSRSAAKVDPDGVLRSDLGRRLGLCSDADPATPGTDRDPSTDPCPPPHHEGRTTP